MKALFGPLCKLDFCKKRKKFQHLALLLLTVSMTNFRKTEFSTIEYFCFKITFEVLVLWWLVSEAVETEADEDKGEGDDVEDVAGQRQAEARL